MTDDARFEDAREVPLNLAAFDAEDVPVLLGSCGEVLVDRAAGHVFAVVGGRGDEADGGHADVLLGVDAERHLLAARLELLVADEPAEDGRRA